MGNAEPDNYNQPILAPSVWWKDVAVKDVLITGGDEEILIDEIREFAAKFKVRVVRCDSPQLFLMFYEADRLSVYVQEAHPTTQVLIIKGEAHDQFLGNAITGSPPGESDGAVFAWIAER